MTDLPDDFTPLPLITRPTAFDHPDWLFEVKHDGYRALAFIDGGCRLVSRNDHQYTRFQDLLDGGLVCLDDQALPDWIGSHQRTLRFFGGVPRPWCRTTSKAALPRRTAKSPI